MRYQKAIETLIKQIHEWYKQENYEIVSEHITVLVNALSSKNPGPASIKTFIEIINQTTLLKLIDSKAIKSLQALSWIDKTIRFANPHSMKGEQEQLAQIQNKLLLQIEEDKNPESSIKISASLSEQTQTENELCLQYKKYFDQMLKLLRGQQLSNLEITELVKSFKNLICKNCLQGDYSQAEKSLEQVLLLCKDYSIRIETNELTTLQQFLYSKKQEPQQTVIPLRLEDQLAAEQIRLGLELAALKIINANPPSSNDELLEKLLIHLLDLSQFNLIINIDLQINSLELMAEITQKFLINQNVGLAYQYLDQAIILAEELNLSEQRCRLNVAQGDLFARKKTVAPEFTNVVESLKRYFDSYLHALPSSPEAVKIATRISSVEICVLYHESKPWIIQRLQKSSNNLDRFTKTFDAVNKQIGHRLIAYHETDLAWSFYADMQSLLTQSTQHWHEEILVKLAEISCIKLNPKLINIKDYPPTNDWQKYRSNLMQNRQAYAKTDKLFDVRQKFYTKSIMRIIAGWLKDAETLIGEPPDRYCILGLGSMSRLTLAPYSDLECMFLAGDIESVQWENIRSAKALYFRTLYRLLELRIASLGELRGFRLDNEGHAGVEIRLRGTIGEVLHNNHHGTPGVKRADEITYSILNPIYLYGDKSLEKEYHQYLTDRLEKPVSKKDGRLWKDFLAVAYLPSHIKDYEKHNSSTEKQATAINIKKDYISPIVYAIGDLCLYYRRRFTNVADFINQLKEEDKILADFANAVLQGTRLADEIRLNLHLHYGEQVDEAMPYACQSSLKFSFTQKQQQALELINWGLLRPLRFVLERINELQDDKDPDPTNNFLYNPLEAVIKQALDTNDEQNLNDAVRSTLYALILAEAKIDSFRLAYLEMPQEARTIFQHQLNTLNDFMSSEKVHLIRLTCLDCPLPNGIRENQQDKEKSFNTMLESLIVEKNNNQVGEGITIQWINSTGDNIEGSLHPEVIRYLTEKGYLKNGKLQITAEKIAETDGRHLVISLNLQINEQIIKLHGKVFPEMPVMECAVGELARLLTGSGTPYAQLARLEVGGQVFPFLLSQTIVGRPLHILIREMGDQLNKVINPRRFHQRVFLSLLLNQEDAKPSNF
ncbi:MAG: hypothetical protein H0T84_11390, partial [Tatlockia sp.]|nr:hypothetical protein [Tatlockia sp.]